MEKKEQKEVIFCQRCAKSLNVNKIHWLELSITDGAYHEEVPAGHLSQGYFPFGLACAKTQLKETEVSND